MAPKPHIPHGWRARLHFVESSGGALVGMPSFGIYDGAAAWGQATTDAIAGAVATAFTGNDIDGAISDRITLRQLQLTNYDTPARADQFSPIGIACGEAGDPLPYNVAVITSFRTQFAGPRFRGRSYWPGYTEASSDANTFDTTSKGHLQDFWDDLQSFLDSYAANMTYAVLSAAALAATPCEAWFVESLFATQRRRLSRFR